MPREPSIPADDTAIGRLVGGKFRVIERLGIGNTASVYRARHEQLGKSVALKLLRVRLTPPTYARRFQREAQTACQLDHPNCVRILDFGRDDDVLYLAMEYVEGETLDALIQREAPMNRVRISELMCQVLAGLAAAHELGIIHRDVKPANVLIAPRTDDEGQPFDCAKVCDFGMAKIYEPDSAEAVNLTDVGVVLGTPNYMSPEQACSQPVDERTDVYACGVILYQMTTGRLPFESATITGVLVKHLREPPVPPSRLVANVDPDLEHMILWCLEKEVGRRCASAKILRRALVKLADEELRSVTDGADFGETVLADPDQFARTAPSPAVRRASKRPTERTGIPEAITEPMGSKIEDADTSDVGVQSEPILLLPQHRKKTT